MYQGSGTRPFYAPDWHSGQHTSNIVTRHWAMLRAIRAVNPWVLGDETTASNTGGWPWENSVVVRNINAPLISSIKVWVSSCHPVRLADMLKTKLNTALQS